MKSMKKAVLMLSLAIIVCFVIHCDTFIHKKPLPLVPPDDQLRFGYCSSFLELKSENLPILYIITPTYSRREQVSVLSRYIFKVGILEMYHIFIQLQGDRIGKNEPYPITH